MNGLSGSTPPCIGVRAHSVACGASGMIATTMGNGGLPDMELKALSKCEPVVVSMRAVGIATLPRQLAEDR